METGFGAVKGNVNTLSAVATLAYDCRRSAYFTDQLYAALTLVDRGVLTAEHPGRGPRRGRPHPVPAQERPELRRRRQPRQLGQRPELHGELPQGPWLARGRRLPAGRAELRGDPGLERRVGLPARHRAARPAHRRPLADPASAPRAPARSEFGLTAAARRRRRCRASGRSLRATRPATARRSCGSRGLAATRPASRLRARLQPQEGRPPSGVQASCLRQAASRASIGRDIHAVVAGAAIMPVHEQGGARRLTGTRQVLGGDGRGEGEGSENQGERQGPHGGSPVRKSGRGHRGNRAHRTRGGADAAVGRARPEAAACGALRTGPRRG